MRQMENERDVLEKMVPLMRRGCSWMCVPEKLNVPEIEKGRWLWKDDWDKSFRSLYIWGAFS